MEEHGNNPEHVPISKESVLASLKQFGKQEAAIEHYAEWTESKRNEIRELFSGREEAAALFAFELEKIEVLIEADFLEEAWEELNGSDGVEGLWDAAVNDEELDKVKALLERIEQINTPAKNDSVPEGESRLSLEDVAALIESRERALESLGYTVIENTDKYTIAKKGGHKFIIKHSITASRYGIDNGRVLEIFLQDEHGTAAWTSDQEPHSITPEERVLFEELLNVLT